MRATLLTLFALVLVAHPAVAGATGGADARDCGKLDDTRSVHLTAYSVSCGKASDVVKRAVRTAITHSTSQRVHGTALGFTCSGMADRHHINISCRRGGGAQFLTARGKL